VTTEALSAERDAAMRAELGRLVALATESVRLYGALPTSAALAMAMPLDSRWSRDRLAAALAVAVVSLAERDGPHG
jgi:hypothetical protein